jgi:hypothetical protein
MLLRTNGPHDDLANNRLKLSQHIAAKKKRQRLRNAAFLSAPVPSREDPPPLPASLPIFCSQPPCRCLPSQALGEAGDSSNPELSARPEVNRYYRDFAKPKADSESIVNADVVIGAAARRLPAR